jgi:hypothetical protein
MAADLYMEAFKLVQNVEKCTPEYLGKLSTMAIESEPSTLDFYRWDKLQLDLADAYLAKGCINEAEQSYTGVIRRTRDVSLRAAAQAGLDRTLARRQPAKSN